MAKEQVDLLHQIKEIKEPSKLGVVLQFVQVILASDWSILLILSSHWSADTRGGQLQEHGRHQPVRDLPQREGGPQEVSRDAQIDNDNMLGCWVLTINPLWS